MKVDSTQKRQNGLFEGPVAKPPTPTALPCVQENIKREAELEVEASLSSPYSVSDVDSSLEDDVWSLTQSLSDAESDTESSDLDAIVTTGSDVCHAATLEAFLENLEFIPAEVNRILKLIGTLDEKCEEITELLEQPCDDWFALHRTKKQRKSNAVESGEAINGEIPSPSIPGNGTRDLMIYRKIYEGQDGIGFDAYKARLSKARKLERQKDMDARSHDLLPIADTEFKIIYEKDGETMGVKEEDNHTKSQARPSSAPSKTWSGVESEVASPDGKRPKPKTPEKTKAPMDLIDHYFHQFDQQTATLDGEGGDTMEIDAGGLQMEEAAMGDDWKEKLDDILQENRMNLRERNDMATLRTFMERQLGLLWRYTLRKKALARKAYEMVLHRYASLVQELEPNQLSASLKCYPEATVIQNAMLNELEEQFVSPEEMTELYKDVDAVLGQCDAADDGCRTALTEPPFPQQPPAAFVKQEETLTAPLFPQESGRKLVMDESYRLDKGANCAARQAANGAVSVYSPSTGSAQAYARSEGPSNVVDANSRRARNKRHKPTKAPSGMSHAAKSPQSTGRLLTHHDIATSTAAEKLSGHPAELFWPDDDLWYLIHIDAIDPETKTANIVYTTGETERLELEDIVREGHMSLLPEAEDTDLSVDEDVPQQTVDVEIGEEAMSDISASELRGAFLDDASHDDDEMGSEDEEEVMANIHRSRQSRRAELKAETMQLQQKTS